MTINKATTAYEVQMETLRAYEGKKYKDWTPPPYDPSQEKVDTRSREELLEQSYKDYEKARSKNWMEDANARRAAVEKRRLEQEKKKISERAEVVDF